MLAIAKGFSDMFDQTAGQIPTSRSTPTPTPTGGQTQGIGHDAMIGNEQHTILTTKDLPGIYQQYVAPALQQSVDLAASGIYATMATRHSGAFQKYGPEIQLELAKVPKQLWTLDNLEHVVNMIYGRHRDDYAREEAQRLISQMEPTIRPTGGGSGPVPTQSEKQNPFESESIPTDWKMRAKQAGINESTIREFCQANDMTPDEFWKQFDTRTPLVAEAQ